MHLQGNGFGQVHVIGGFRQWQVYTWSCCHFFPNCRKDFLDNVLEHNLVAGFVQLLDCK